MEKVIVNKKAVRASKALRGAQKAAKKYYGRARGKSPKLKINTMVNLLAKDYISVIEDDNLVTFSPDLTLLEMIEKSELTGLSGNGFSVAEKIKTYQASKGNNKILIVNAVECDPGLVHDKWLYHNRLDDVMKGIGLLNVNLNFEKVIFATKEPVTKEVVNVLGQSGKNQVKVFMVQVPNRYPMGQEKLLIESILGISMTKQQIPAEEGILVMNIQTVYSIAKMWERKAKENCRLITVANLLEGTAKTVEVKIGMDAKSVLSKVMPGISAKTYIGGGVMSAHEIAEGETITPSTNLIAWGSIPDYENAGPCKGCGACSAKCPRGVKVHKIVQSMEKGGNEDFSEFHPEQCIGCGACTYVCRAGKNPQKCIAKANGKIVD